MSRADASERPTSVVGHSAADGHPGVASQPTAVATVVAALQARILDEMEPGAQLAAEGDIAAAYGVSRLTVREALKVLAGRGLIRSQRGRRPEVCEPDSSILSAHLTMAGRRDQRSVLELIEIRQSLEVLVSGLAARNATRASLAAIRTALEDMSVAADKLDSGDSDPTVVAAYNAADVAFHEALALASGNRMLAFLLEGFEGPLRQSFAQSFRGYTGRGDAVRGAVVAHTRILDCVRAGDIAGAEQAMSRDLRQTERDLQSSSRRSAPSAR